AANKELKASVSQELATAAERRELEDEIERMRTELESLRSQRGELEQEVRLLHSNLDGARNDQARLEGDVLSLTEAIALLKAELKVEGQKSVAAYKGSRGFKSGLEKIWRVSYEFGYQVALERLRGKHPDIMIEVDPFAKCPEDANVEMDSISLSTMAPLREATDPIDTSSFFFLECWAFEDLLPTVSPGHSVTFCYQIKFSFLNIALSAWL
ncbi:hypothetical protein BHE74_00009303, partial [Ensete ventricosum]